MTENKQSYRGVGGWLMFFAIAATVLGPLRAFGMLASEWKVASDTNNSTITGIVWIETATTGLAALLGIGAGLTILLRSPHGRTAARIFLWSNIVLSVLGGVGVLMISDGAIQDAIWGQTLGGVLGTCFASGLWLWYFHSSKRVRATYETTDAGTAVEDWGYRKASR